MTSLATAIGGMKHWDWCPICRGGLDTGLECDQCGADLMPVYKAFKDLQARPSDSVVLRAIKARADRSRLGYGGKAWVTSDPKSEVVEDRMLLVEIVCRQEFAINRLRAALNEAADSFKNVGLSVDAENCEEAINESLSGGNPSEPKACTGAEERGISGATGAGQLPDGNPESTGDSTDRRSPAGHRESPAPDGSTRHPHEPPQPVEATGLQCEKDGVCALVSRNDDEWHCTACNGDFVRKQPVEPGGWRPIKTAPKKGRFMVWIPATDLAWPAYAGGDWIYSNAHGALNEMQDGRVLTATHWMPLPSAPVTKGETP